MGIDWNFFDSNADVNITERKRPHWDQPNAVTFVTIRLNDSMPKAVVANWLAAQKDWLCRKGLTDIDLETLLSRQDLPYALRRAFTKFRNQLWNQALDHCHGSCLFSNPTYARIVADALMHFEGDRYDLDRFVIMPNHIHREQKSSGHLWAEPFDHVVRNETQFEYLRQYVVDNPVKAKLPRDKHLLWVRETD